MSSDDAERNTELQTEELALSCLGSVMVGVFAIGPNVRLFKPGRGDVLLRVIEISNTPSFEGEAKPETPCRKSLRKVKDHFEVWTKTRPNSSPVLPACC
jgi:hypothetical protein